MHPAVAARAFMHGQSMIESPATMVLRQVAIPVVGRVFATRDEIVWKVDSPGLPRFFVGVVLQVQFRLVVSEHVDVPRRDLIDVERGHFLRQQFAQQLSVEFAVA